MIDEDGSPRGRKYVAMIGRPCSSAHIDVWLINSCRCGIADAVSAVAAVIGNAYGVPSDFCHVRPPSVERA